ncbi:MAG TPA: LuxR C-terminal-related transcriptional regulator [Blastococcus sp.]|nr:LuxR C-terminal-related transcriptional regulator [Blastococcus sp.]
MASPPGLQRRRGDAQAMAPDPQVPLHVPASKIAVPELPRQFAPRTMLLPRLDSATADQVVLVSAPAGSGKTLLLAHWVRTRDEPATAWVTLDPDDNDPRRLWSAVMVALLGIPAVSQNDRMRRMVRDMVTLGTPDLLDELADTLDTLDPPVRIVLDDVHELTGQQVLHDLNQLIRRRPAGLRLVLASRSDPPISAPRLRLEGRLHEVRADLLRFTPHDTAALLSAGGLTLTRPQVAMLHARTEGWAAGLRLALLALQRTDDPAAFLTEFSGDERSVADYLTGEILPGLAPDLQDFMRSVSLCSPLPVALAAELSSRPDAERLLDDLRQQTALVERTGSGEYRIHALLRSYLAADLARLRQETYRLLQVRAGRWWAARGEPVHALRHAERAADRDLITQLLHGSGVTLFLNGDLGPLQRALAAVGDAARRTDPMLALLAATTHLEMRALPSAATELQSARLAWPAQPDAGLVALRLSVELLASAIGMPGDVPAGLAPDVEPAQPELGALLHASRGLAAFNTPGGQHRDISRAELERALELARLNDLGYLEVQSLAMLATMHEDHPGMVSMAEQAVTAATRRGRHPSVWTAGPAGLLAYADLQRGDPVGAAARSGEALGTWDQLPPEATYMLRAVHGAALADQGRRAAGLAEMHSARLEFAGSPASPWMSAAVAALEHRVALLQGNPEAAAEVAGWLAARVGETCETVLLEAWTESAAGRPHVARTVVAPILRGDLRRLVPHTLVEALLLEAEGALQVDEHEAGSAALERAVTEAEPMDVVRPFGFAGPRVQELLGARSVARSAARSRGAFGTRLEAARAAVAPDAAVQLSERELAILALLPTLMNAREIAAEFTVSVNTVKSHVRSIYAKLHVSSRREAVLEAHERGLIP